MKKLKKYGILKLQTTKRGDSMLKYESLSKEIEERIRTDREQNTLPAFGFCEKDVIRRNPDRDKTSLLRPAFVRDIDKIMHSPYYNRYADKTQVFSFYKNDDLTRRGLHVQLVSRVARTIGKALNLNLELIEAIALGHDIGHTPFGHAGEHILDELICEHTGRRFSHNIHSVRVLDGIFPYNISLQTLSGIAAHDGENEMGTYKPQSIPDFDTFDAQIEACYQDKTMVKKLIPSTLEGCVMRVSDIIAYLGKDRQDAERAHIADSGCFSDSTIGIYNAQILNNMVVNIVEHSYGKPYIQMDSEHFEALKQAKAENYQQIYLQEAVGQATQTVVKPMMSKLYEKLLADLTSGNTASPIFTHHIRYINQAHYARQIPYEETEANQIVMDYIASMTDDYFIDLFDYLFPDSTLKIKYKGYFK